jgi:tetrahydromethanopterin S-methyltransferase subunit A
MRKAPDISETLPPKAASMLNEIARGMELKKCRKCGCMKDALNQATRAFGASEEPEIRALLPRIFQFQARMEPIAYDCIGCKKCWGADATIQLADHFEEVQIDSCVGGNERTGDAPNAVAERIEKHRDSSTMSSWPPHPGDYVLGNPDGTVAVCTLSNRDLPRRLIAAKEPALAIAGRCDTENIGVEKIVLNLSANPRIRWLVICGEEAKGHRAGDALLRLKERGVDANMRVLESASWRPILKNLSLLDVAYFRQQIEEVNLSGVTDLDRILATVRECFGKPVQDLPSNSVTVRRSGDLVSTVEHIRAKAPRQLRLDRAGFFIVLPQPQTGLIICEHYENSGRLAHVIEGRQGALIAATIVERGLLTQLDHAAYLGRELQKAEAALSAGIAYEQDAAIGTLTAPQQESEFNKRSETDSECAKGAACSC